MQDHDPKDQQGYHNPGDCPRESTPLKVAELKRRPDKNKRKGGMHPHLNAADGE